MSSKESNEVTVKVICSKNELIEILSNKGFTKSNEYYIDDYYFIPSDLDINNLPVREILSKAIILRYIVNNGKVIQKITFKRKNIAENGDILSQESINCDILDIGQAKNLFKAIGYSEIMNIKEDDIVYSKDSFELTLKFIRNGDILIEIETENNTNWNTIEKIKVIIDKLDLPIEKNKYFIKKAEDELSKLLER